MAGYSGTPLAKKLGIREGATLVLVNAPDHYLSLVDPLPDGVRIRSRISSRTDIVHIFSTTRAHLEKMLGLGRAGVPDEGMIWVSWPKKTSRVPTDITEDTIRKVGFPLGLVDVKVCAVDEVWSGLKLVVRKEDRRAPRAPRR